MLQNRMLQNSSSLVVTGVDGFVGRHVARQAKAAGMAVHGIGYSGDCLLYTSDAADE